MIYMFIYHTKFNVVVTFRKDDNMRVWDTERAQYVIGNIPVLGLDGNSTIIYCTIESK